MTQKPTITTVEQLMEIDPAPCDEAIEWLAENGITELADAWDRCHRADWMLWLCGTLFLLSDRERRLIACRCVRETPIIDGRKVWDLLTDKRSRHAVEIAERYVAGDATDEELSAAAWAASNAAWNTSDVAADAAAAAAAAAAVDAVQASAAGSAMSAAWAAAHAVAAAYAATTTAAYATTAAATAAARAAQADIIREIAGNPFRREEQS
jgi:hypothetical protein